MSAVMKLQDRIFYLHVNSEDCQQQSTLNTDLYLKINPILKTRDENHYFLVSLANIQVPYSMYNINPKNNFFTIIEANANGSSPHPIQTITIPNGSYNAVQLASEITSLLNTATVHNASYLITYSKITGKFRYEITNGNKGATLGFPSDITAYIQMGFDVGDTPFFSSTSPINSANVINVNDYEAIFLRTDLSSLNAFDTLDPLVTGGDFGSSTSDILQKVDIRVPFRGIIYKSEGDVTQYNFTTKQEIGQINVRLTNKYNQLLNLNGLPWSFSLMFEEINQQTYLPEFENRRVKIPDEVKQSLKILNEQETNKQDELTRLKSDEVEENLLKLNLL